MTISNLEELRNSNGYIDLDKIENKRMQQNIVGRKPKAWILLEDGRIMFKETYALSYEDLSQLFFAEFLEQCGLEHANYDLAIMNGKKGIITPDFTKEGELLLSGETLLNLLKTTYEQNNINQPVCNSVENIIEALRLINVNEETINETSDKLIRRLIIDAVLLETDRNSTNWSIKTTPQHFEFIKDPKNKHLLPLNETFTKLELAPVYDGSNIFGLNRSITDIQSKIKNIRDTGTIYSIISNSKRSFSMNSKTQDQPFIEELQYICQQYPDIIKDFIPKILDLSVDEAQFNIETKIKKEIPFEILIWMDKILKYNKENILYACKELLEEEKERRII